MTSPKPDPFLITGIPGTGKTTFGDTGAKDFGFHHHNLEDIATLTRWAANPTEFVQGIVRQKRNSVVTWDFVPDHVPSVQSVLDFKKSGFKLVWFDGNRPAALQAFRRRGTVSEEALGAQMQRIEKTRIVEQLKPTIINPFNDDQRFKSTTELLDEIRRT